MKFNPIGYYVFKKITSFTQHYLHKPDLPLECLGVETCLLFLPLDGPGDPTTSDEGPPPAPTIGDEFSTSVTEINQKNSD